MTPTLPELQAALEAAAKSTAHNADTLYAMALRELEEAMEAEAKKETT